MAAPSLRLESFAHTTLCATISEPANVPTPQSVDEEQGQSRFLQLKATTISSAHRSHRT